jgi:TatD DNase family protein
VVDSHCHLADEAFVEDLSAVIARARSAGLTHALCILAAGNAVEAGRASFVRTLWSGVRTAIGVHPHQAGEFEGREQQAAEVAKAQLAGDPASRAVGEIGLDYHYNFAPRSTQQNVFRGQIQLARQLDLPIIIHTREAEDDTLGILREESDRDIRGVLHCFTGTRGMAEQALALGLHISFAGIVTFPKAVELREIVPLVPENRLLCETDSPYLAPTPYRGKRNEPAWVVRVAEELAALRKTPPADLQARIASNFAALFRP